MTDHQHGGGEGPSLLLQGRHIDSPSADEHGQMADKVQGGAFVKMQKGLTSQSWSAWIKGVRFSINADEAHNMRRLGKDIALLRTLPDMHLKVGESTFGL